MLLNLKLNCQSNLNHNHQNVILSTLLRLLLIVEFFEFFSEFELLLKKLLGVTIDNHLKFESHIKNWSSKASQKLYALPRVSLHVSLNQRRMVMKSFIMSQFGYCPLIWMNHNWNLNNNNRIHERALRIVYIDKKSTLRELLEKDNCVIIHMKNLQILTNMYKMWNNCSQEIMSKVFPTNKPIYEYDLRNTSYFAYHTLDQNYEISYLMNIKSYNL